MIVDQILTYVAHREVLPWFPHWIDRWTYRRADGILTHSETMRRELVAAFALDGRRVEVAYPVLDLELFSRRYDAEADALRRVLGVKDRFVVLYHGMWHPWHGLPYIYEAARLLEAHPGIVFVVIPKDGEPNRANLLFVEEQPFERLPVYLQMADAWCSGFDSDARGERAFSSTLKSPPTVAVSRADGTFSMSVSPWPATTSASSAVSIAVDWGRIWATIRRRQNDRPRRPWK